MTTFIGLKKKEYALHKDIFVHTELSTVPHGQTNIVAPVVLFPLISV